MSSDKNTFIPIPFIHWFRENEEDLKKEYDGLYGVQGEIRCHDCDGQGHQTCDMGHDHDCEYCDGDGWITPDVLFEEFAKDQYNQQLKNDRKKYQEFLSCQ